MENRIKIAYLMHIEWDWIKQRPHFIYEELTRYFEVDLFFINKFIDKNKNENRNERNTYSASRVSKLMKLPLSGRFGILRTIEKVINYKLIKSLVEYDIVWITSPLILDFVPLFQLDNKIVIYDCMDDFLGFYRDTQTIARMEKLESKLVQRSNFIFVSSDYLKITINNRYPHSIKKKSMVINNGISDSLINMIPDKGSTLHSLIPSTTGMTNLVYIGTIGEWIDFDSILKVLDIFSNVMFTFIGPMVTNAPEHTRINYLGVIKHQNLLNFAISADALIMPFKLNELVRAVDPVKIYEYIYFSKPIIAIDYKEMHKFKPFVNLYSNDNELFDLIRRVQKGEFVIEKGNIRGFLGKNTWSVRAKQIVSILEGVSK